MPAIGLGVDIIGFIGFPIGRGSRFCGIAGNAAGLHAIGFRARGVTSRVGPSAIDGRIHAIGRSSSGALFFICRRPLLRHRRRNGA